MADHRRGPWSEFEDAALIQLVQQQGPLNWVKISDTIVSRSPKQCRERYHQNLKPTLNHEPISTEEGQLIEKLVGELGKRWAEIARRLNNRSDNAVKNWWNGSQNRRKRTFRKKSSGGNNGHRRLTAPLDHPRRPQLELATGTAHVFQADHRHEPLSPCMVQYSHTVQNAPPSSGLPSPHSDRSSLYSIPVTKDTLPPGSPIALPPLRRNSYDAMKHTLRPEPLLPPVSAAPNFRLPPIQTLAVGEHHALPTAPNSPSDSGPGAIQKQHDLSRSFPRHPFGPVHSRRGSQNDDGDARLRVSHIVD
ncbi:Homeodomain-like protein [Xylaria bambusicola]|uniref:Homeodomain-like protein n=1 Tax=Xylaria bambusicola TaxID=326684 RepID=UPI0020072460|nr:Homeodomain-like protein [Xylaria bambusicola]KAI0515338.1 Homeodomain-like protein [Xylaria bambusicola]